MQFRFVGFRLRSSMDNLVDDSDHSEQLVTFPDEDNTPTEERDLGDFSVATVRAPNSDQLALHNTNNNNGLLNKVESAADVVKFEEKRTASASNRKIVTNGFSSEQVRQIPHLSQVTNAVYFKTTGGQSAPTSSSRITNRNTHSQLFIPPHQATANSSEMKHLQTGDIDYKEASAAAAVRNKIEVGGITAEQNAATIKVITRT